MTTTVPLLTTYPASVRAEELAGERFKTLCDGVLTPQFRPPLDPCRVPRAAANVNLTGTLVRPAFGRRRKTP